MRYSGKLGSKAGVTLVELLVVMLIVVILAVSLIPLFKDYIVRSKYTAEAVPVVADLRVKATMFDYEEEFLPGVERDTTTGDPLSEPGDSALGGNLPLQTFYKDESGDVTKYLPGAVSDADLNGVGTVAEITGPDHFSSPSCLNVDYAHFTGNNIKPNHVFYRTDWAGYKQGGHMFVIGVFGDGSGLDAGTGYAVMELHNPTAETKIVATWERWRPENTTGGQIAMLEQAEAPAADDYTEEEVCFIGNPDDLVSGNGTAFNTALDALRKAGWKW